MPAALSQACCCCLAASNEQSLYSLRNRELQENKCNIGEMLLAHVLASGGGGRGT
jgi:hypothetical protein